MSTPENQPQSITFTGNRWTGKFTERYGRNHNLISGCEVQLRERLHSQVQLGNESKAHKTQEFCCANFFKIL